MADNKSIGLCSMQRCGEQDELLEWLTADRINEFIGGDVSATFAVAAEAGDAIAVTVQMVDADGVALAAQYSAWAWLSDTALAAVTADAPSGGTAATTGTILQEHATDVSLDFLTNASGVFVLAITEAGVDTWFLNVRLPSGLVVSSAAITFA
jgi:hypothetical protein